jgi:hypothetical protein
MCDRRKELAEHVRERDLGRDEVKAAQAACEQLQRDLMLETEALKRADEQVRSAAKLVAIEDREALVAELNERLKHVFTLLRDELAALTKFVPQGELWSTGRLQVSRMIIDRLQAPSTTGPRCPGNQNYGTDETGRWGRARDANAVR